MKLMMEPEEIGEDCNDHKMADKQMNHDLLPNSLVRSCPRGHWRSKYRTALKTLKPIRRKSREYRQLPLESAGLLSYLSQSWLTATMMRAYRSGLSLTTDLYELPKQEKAMSNAERLQRIWQEEIDEAGKDDRKPSLVWCVWIFARTRILLTCVILTVSTIFQFLGPSILLRLLLEFLSQPTWDDSCGWFLVIALLLSQLIRNITLNINFSLSIQTSMRVFGATQFLAYSKLLRLSNPNVTALAQLITYCTNNQEQVIESLIAGLLVIVTPITFIMSLVYLSLMVDAAALAGILVILLLYPLMGIAAMLAGKLRLRVMAATSQRIARMSEIINSIRLIKMCGWEESFREQIALIRRHEVKELRRSAFLQSVTTSLIPSSSVIAAVVSFLALTSTGYKLDAPNAFAIFSIFSSSLEFTVSSLSFSLKCLAEGRVAMKKLQQFMELPEYSPREKTLNLEENVMIKMKNAKFSWPMLDNNGGYCLRNINFNIKKGDLVGVAGAVGSGKSALPGAILGKLEQLEGEVDVKSTKLAYVSQQAWIFSGNIRENILFGLNYHKETYKRVLSICCLQEDLDNFPQGDLTEIGERGINLSGGQKQRVNLARALYADMDGYLLDDPLSALDVIVAQNVFRQCILEELKDKTVVLICNGIQYLEQCDTILFLSQGRITQNGSHEELVKMDGMYNKFLSFGYTHENKDENNIQNKNVTSKVSATVPILIDKIKEKEINAHDNEESNPQQAGWSVLLQYFRASGGYLIMSLLFLAVFTFTLSRLFVSISMQVWLDIDDDNNKNNNNNNSNNNNNNTTNALENTDLWLFQTILPSSVLIMLLLGIAKGAWLAFQLLSGSNKLHDRMLSSVLRCPMSFFDNTPTGRILNRFSKDMDELDTQMPYFTETVCQSCLFCISQILIACIVYPMFILPMLIIVVIFIMLDLVMNKGILEARKLENMAKSEVLHQLTSTMSGAKVIRGFRRQQVFQQKFNKALNRHLSAQTMFRFSNCWFVFRMDLLGLTTIAIAAAFAVGSKGTVTPAMAGLVLVNVFQTCTFIPFVMKVKADFRARFNSVERVAEYADDLTQEAPARIPGKTPPTNWPKMGEIVFEQACFRYHVNHPLILRELSFTILPREKIGIVGRTGAGKSTLISALLRLNELDAGKITIDGLDVSQIGLTDLRSSVSVIPQDPTLFKGTIRYNMDPFDEHSDADIWSALEKAHLKEKVVLLSQAVDTEGDNFSVGERQLVCLARALLRRNIILLLDEATSSVDVRTDLMIQETIREAFADCTVLTVAHRLDTVAKYDRIMVLHEGQMVEFDKPDELMKITGGVFYSMIRSSQFTDNNRV